MRRLTERYGVSEVLHSDDGAYYHDAWWWCRSHRRPELGSWTMIDCVRVGPLMREEEAEGVGRGLGEFRQGGDHET